MHRLFVVEINVVVSALAGAGSFFSPCILPILPAFISYLSGTTLHEVQNSNNSNSSSNTINTITTTTAAATSGGSAAAAAAAAKQSLTVKRSTRLNIFLNTVYFVLGFSLVFAVLGVILNSVLVTVGIGFQSALQSIGGVVIILFGAYLILSTKLRRLNFEKKMTKLPRFKTSYITSFVFGAAFAAGWTPCFRLGHTIPNYWCFLLTSYRFNQKNGKIPKIFQSYNGCGADNTGHTSIH
ncbi:MAG: ccdA [Nitrososphaeraceae archaeon]|nr:ccdA [Nitrososphaeraceae archaeon]